MVLGRILGAHGLRGQVRVKWLGDGPDNLSRMPEVGLARTPDDAAPRRFVLERVGPGRPGEARVTLQGVTDRDAAEALRGLVVLGEASRLEALPPGEHYWFEWIGCRVEGSTGRTIGTVKEIWETGAHDVLVVEAEDGRRVLLPAARELLREIDVPGQRLVIEEIPGLVDPV